MNIQYTVNYVVRSSKGVCFDVCLFFNLFVVRTVHLQLFYYTLTFIYDGYDGVDEAVSRFDLV